MTIGAARHATVTWEPPISTPPTEPPPPLPRPRPPDRRRRGVRHRRAPRRSRCMRVRIAFVLLLGLNGLGLLLYAAFWAVLPLPPGPTGTPARRDLLPAAAVRGDRAGRDPRAGAGPASAGSARRPAGWSRSSRSAPASSGTSRTRSGAGGGARRCPQVPWLGAVVEESDRRAFLLRFIGGGVLVAVGIIGVVAVYAPGRRADMSRGPQRGDLRAGRARRGRRWSAAPVLWRTFSQLRAEREGRIREQERAELAAMVHDQVLHTLALIQRNAADVKTVQRLARGQERSLRNWLYKPTALADRAVRRRAGAGRRRGRGHVRDHGRGRRGRRPRASTSGSARWSPPPARRWSTRPGTPRCRPSRSTPRSSPSR